MPEVFNKYARTKLGVIATGAAMVALGIAVFVNPIGAVTTLVRLVGWGLVAFGVLALVSQFTKTRRPWDDNLVELIFSAVAVVLGFMMALSPGWFVTLVWTIIGAMILITGILDVIEADPARRARSSLGLPATASGIVTIALGVLVIVAPFFSSALVMVIAGIALLIDGVTEIIFGLGM